MKVEFSSRTPLEFLRIAVQDKTGFAYRHLSNLRSCVMTRRDQTGPATEENEGMEEVEAFSTEESSQEETEITALSAAVKKVRSRIQWHRERIAALHQDANDHQDQIVELEGSLRREFGSL
jgi:peptidoglycan hydrolase CwlO-like protein